MRRSPILPIHARKRDSSLRVLLLAAFACILFVVYRTYGHATFKQMELFGQGSPVVIITPTYRRADQATRLAYMASVMRPSASHVFWILIDDGRTGADPTLINDLNDAGVSFWFLTPTLNDNCPGYTFGTCYNSQGHRGVTQRNLALRFIREKLYLYCDKEYVNSILSAGTSDYGHVDPFLGEQGRAEAFGGGCPVERIPKLLRTEPIVYFADDDNSYDVDLFRELTKVKRFGMVSVGFPLKPPHYISAPVVSPEGQVTAFDTFLCFDRPFPLDMANLAFSAKFLHESLPTLLINKYKSAEWLQPYLNASQLAALVRNSRGQPRTREETEFIAKSVGYKFPEKNEGSPPVRFYLHTRKYHLETDLLEQLMTSAREFEVLGEKGTRVLAWHEGKPKAYEKAFEENKIGRYVTVLNQPAISRCKIAL